MTSSDTCAFCDGIVERRQIRARIHFHGQTIYVDHVPAWVCAKRGEQYVDASVSERLAEIARQRERLTETVCFPLAAYAMALH